MEDEIVASQVAQEMMDNQSSLLSPLSPVSRVSTKSARSVKSVRSSGSKKRNGTIKEMSPPPLEQEEQFTGISCLLITWKSNPEVEQFKVKQKLVFSLKRLLSLSKDKFIKFNVKDQEPRLRVLSLKFLKSN